MIFLHKADTEPEIVMTCLLEGRRGFRWAGGGLGSGLGRISGWVYKVSIGYGGLVFDFHAFFFYYVV